MKVSKNNNHEKAIINAAMGFWYPEGQNRLEKSLQQYSLSWDFLKWTNVFPDISKSYQYNINNPYTIKTAAFEVAMNMGYKQLFWLDCSILAIKNPQPILDIINREGFFTITNGFNARQECSDRCLNYFNISRQKAELIPMCSSGILGVNLDFPKPRQFLELWIKSAKDGIFDGSRHHDNQSNDPKFLHHRQDQSCASLIIHQLGLKIYPMAEIAVYGKSKKGILKKVMNLISGTNSNHDVIFKIQGGPFE